MIALEKSHQNLSDHNQILFRNRFKVNKNRFFRVNKLEIQVIVFMIMLTRSSEMIFNPMCYTGVVVDACMLNITYHNAYVNVNLS